MLPVGIFNSTLHDCVIGDDVCIKNVAYLKNYFVESHVILFNIQEMSCTLHSKFGNGILKSGEPEEKQLVCAPSQRARRLQGDQGYRAQP